VSDRGQPNEMQVLDSTYSATLTVRRSRTTRKANANGYFDAPPLTSDGELACLKITSTTLEGLGLKIKQHTDLLEDE